MAKYHRLPKLTLGRLIVSQVGEEGLVSFTREFHDKQKYSYLYLHDLLGDWIERLSKEYEKMWALHLKQQQRRENAHDTQSDD